MNELTDRVAFCVVKANCRGPSFLQGEKSALGDDIWVCRHCSGHITTPPGKQPEKDQRSEYENTRQ